MKIKYKFIFLKIANIDNIKNHALLLASYLLTPLQPDVDLNNVNTFQYLEAVAQRCSVKKMFLEISQKSQENTCVIVSFLNKVAGLRLWHRRFPVNFAKFLRTLFVREHLWRLFLSILQQLL